MDYVVDCLCDALEEIAANLETGIVGYGVDPAEIEAVERALAEEDRRLDKLMELYYADAITLEEFKSRKTASDDTTGRLAAKLEELRGRDSDPLEIAFSVREALGILRDESVSAEDKNVALKSFVDRIEYEELDTARKNRQIKLTVHLHGFD